MSKRNFLPTAAEHVVVAVPAASALEPASREVPVAARSSQNSQAGAAGLTREPERMIPGDDALLRAFAATRTRLLNVGEHIHNSECLEQGCELLGQKEQRPGFSQYMVAALAVAAGLIVWPLQYAFATPLIGLRYAARTSRGRGWGVVAVIFGCGIFMSIAYVGMSNVPRTILAPWGTYRAAPTGGEPTSCAQQ
jgi:hypothetical protein